jgi:hypothetical protein
MIESTRAKVKGIIYMSVSMRWVKKALKAIRRDLRRMRDEWECAELAKEESLQVWLHPKADIGVLPRSTFLEMEEEAAHRAEQCGVEVYLLGNELSLEVNLWDDRILEYTERDIPKDVIEPLNKKG